LQPSANSTPPKETLVGSVERVTFHNEDNGFPVLKVKPRGKRDLGPVVGHVASISAGDFIHAVGVWITDRAHGLQQEIAGADRKHSAGRGRSALLCANRGAAMAA
jgi:exodeoxyribonuclease V alpha subunit